MLAELERHVDNKVLFRMNYIFLYYITLTAAPKKSIRNCLDFVSFQKIIIIIGKKIHF